MRYNICTNWEPPYAHKHPCSGRARTKLERVIAQIDRAVPLKVCACGGTSEGSSAEVFMLEHALCRSNLSSDSPLRLHLKLEKILYSTCRAPVVLSGVEIVHLEGRILNLVQYSGDSNSCLLLGCGMDG